MIDAEIRIIFINSFADLAHKHGEPIFGVHQVNHTRFMLHSTLDSLTHQLWLFVCVHSHIHHDAKIIFNYLDGFVIRGKKYHIIPAFGAIKFQSLCADDIKAMRQFYSRMSNMLLHNAANA